MKFFAWAGRNADMLLKLVQIAVLVWIALELHDLNSSVIEVPADTDPQTNTNQGGPERIERQVSLHIAR